MERADTRDEYWYVKRDDGEVVALFFGKHDAVAYANWKNETRHQLPSNGLYRN